MGLHSNAKYIEKRRNCYYINLTYKGRRYRKTLQTSDINTAVSRAAAFKYVIVANAPAELANDEQIKAEKLRKNWILNRLYWINCRNRKTGIPELTKDDLEEIYKRSGGICEVTGIPFSFEPHGGKRATYAPSFDRVDSSRGYTKSNMRIVCFVVNIAMNQWGEDVLYKISESIATRFLHESLEASTRATSSP